MNHSKYHRPNIEMSIDEFFMSKALKEAKKAYEDGEVPVGAIIVKDNKIVARGHNQKEKKADPTCHAEIVAIRKACKLIGWRLNNCDIYVTLEPCPMCAGALIQARIKRLFFGTFDPKAGAVGSVINLFNNNFNHKVEVKFGILAEQCSEILKVFFNEMRSKL